MYLNQFSVRIPEGQEISDAYVKMQHGTQYSIVLRNDRAVRCDAKVQIDGRDMGTYRINAKDSIRLERASHDNGRFTFYKVGSQEGYSIGLNAEDPNLGLVKVTFTPEIRPYQFSDGEIYYRGLEKGISLNCQTFGTSRGMTAGGTGLSGYSDQSFTNASRIEYDYSQKTVIHLRLGAEQEVNKPRPLCSKSNPVPPPLNSMF